MRALHLLVLLVVGLSVPARAAGPAPLRVRAEQLESLAFSNLIVRVKGEAWIGAAPDAVRVEALEHLRRRGYPALGAESLVFDQDKSSEARFLLGGTVVDVDCLRGSRCRVAVDWELFDRSRGQVVYRVRAWFASFDVRLNTPENREKSALELVLGALDALLSRSRFVDTLKKRASFGDTGAAGKLVGFRQCVAEPRLMPGAANEVIGATVLVETSTGFGSGTFVSPDGLVLTAAHVVTGGNVKVRTAAGSMVRAQVVRINQRHDVAFLYAPLLGDAPCLPLRLDPPAMADEIYAIGSPASKELAFSLTRGIVSGVREIDGSRYLQTDASVSPGNSGGPMLDTQGRVIGVVSWKVVGGGNEGLAFGVPAQAALEALSLEPGDATDPSLRTPPAAKPEPPALAFDDTPDLEPSLDPEGDRQRQLDTLQRQSTPRYVKAMKWGGLGLTGASLIGVLASWLRFTNGDFTYESYRNVRRRNDVWWGGTFTGIALTITGIVLTPRVKLPDTARTRGRPVARAGAGAGSLFLDVRF
jgi:serine protease Do